MGGVTGKTKMTYPSYCEDMKRLGHEPSSEFSFNKMMGETAPLPKVRVSRTARPKDPILELYKDVE